MHCGISMLFVDMHQSGVDATIVAERVLGLPR